MEPLFLQLLRRFHVPAGVRTLEEFQTLRGLMVAGTVECRNKPILRQHPTMRGSSSTADPDLHQDDTVDDEESCYKDSWTNK